MNPLKNKGICMFSSCLWKKAL